MQADGNYAAMRGGLWSVNKPVYSAQTQNLLKTMMQEAKLTNFQQRTLNGTLRSGGTLPSKLAPTFSVRERQPIIEKQPLKFVTPKTAKGGLKKFEDIVMSGAYEKPDYKPRPVRAITDKEKDRLGYLMAYGTDIEQLNLQTKNNQQHEEDESEYKEIDRFDELKQEIQERKEFLNEMDCLGRGKEFRQQILTEISQMRREMELIDKKRTDELNRLLNKNM